MSKRIQVNGKTISIKSTTFLGTKDYIYYEKQIYSALKKIGVEHNYITIIKLNSGIKVLWEINKETFEFTCQSQKSLQENCGAIAQAIQEDVRQITRGIKDLNLTMKQYQLGEGEGENKKKRGFGKCEKNIEKEENTIKIKDNILTKNDARIIIKEIKEKYISFTDFKYIPEHDRNRLREAYLYLGIETKF